MKEITILTALCGAIALGCFAAAGYALVGGKDVAVEQIFAVMVWGLLGLVFGGIAAYAAKQGKKPGPPPAAEGEPGAQAAH